MYLWHGSCVLTYPSIHTLGMLVVQLRIFFLLHVPLPDALPLGIGLGRVWCCSVSECRGVSHCP